MLSVKQNWCAPALFLSEQLFSWGRKTYHLWSYVIFRRKDPIGCFSRLYFKHVAIGTVDIPEYKYPCGTGGQKHRQSSISNSLSFYKMIKNLKAVLKAERFWSNLVPGHVAMLMNWCCFSSWVQDLSWTHATWYCCYFAFRLLFL